MSRGDAVDEPAAEEGVVGAAADLGPGFRARLWRRARLPSLGDLAGRTGLLAISVRNPRFSNALVAAFGRLCRERLGGGVVTVVDRPYERNVRAGRLDAASERGALETLERMAREARGRAERVLARHAGARARLVAWDDLAAATPSWMGEEVRRAFARRGRFHADVVAQTRAAVPGLADPAQVERYAEFVLDEVPVLLHAYYGGPSEVVDVYPGPQVPVFWRLEAGAYADEMPALARRLDVRGGLVYLDLREGPVDPAPRGPRLASRP